MRLDTRTALILVIVGMAGIFISEQLYTPQTLGTDTSIDYDLLGERVRFSGSISSISQQTEITFITLKERRDLHIVTFTDIGNVKAGDNVTITGVVKLYQGQLEVVAQRIQTP